MKTPWMVIMALACLAPLGARAQVFLPIPFRGNDPLVFCTEGWSPVGGMGWRPLPPYTMGTYIILRPQKFWSPADWVALWYYQTVCPGAMAPGVWSGPTPAKMTPVPH